MDLSEIKRPNRAENNQIMDSVYDKGIKPHMYKPYEYFQHQCEVDYDSEEGMKILDDWVNRYSNILIKKSKENVCIISDLSGGMDSRAILALILISGIKSKILFHNADPYKLLERRKKGDKVYLHPKFIEDYKIAGDIAKKFGLSVSSNSYWQLGMPKIMGVCSTFKTRSSFTGRRVREPDFFGPFKEPFERWINEHPNCDNLDKSQMAWEITFNNWHDYSKLEDKLIIAPFADYEIHKLKNKEYGLWKFFMKKYCPELLEFPVEGRGIIS